MAVAASVGSDLALATAGVKLNVVGEEHLWSNRPCVFLFNHQSQLDMLLLGALLRRDFTAVARRNSNTTRYSRRLDIWQASPTSTVRTARKHAKHSSQLLRHCGKADRSRLRQKEHARPRLACCPSKKGAFHMAMQAGVPVVPIVMRNAGDIMRPHSLVISNGTVDVAVLKPISSKGWTTKNIGRQAEKVRQLYLDTMAHWPANDSRCSEPRFGNAKPELRTRELSVQRAAQTAGPLGRSQWRYISAMATPLSCAIKESVDTFGVIACSMMPSPEQQQGRLLGAALPTDARASNKGELSTPTLNTASTPFPSRLLQDFSSDFAVPSCVSVDHPIPVATARLLEVWGPLFKRPALLAP